MVLDIQWRGVDLMWEFYQVKKETVQERIIQISQQKQRILLIKWVKVQKDEFLMFMDQLLPQMLIILTLQQLKSTQLFLEWGLVIDHLFHKFLKLQDQDNTPLPKNLQKLIRWMEEIKCI